MLRTLQTASLALDWLVERGVKFEASADWQETSSKPCDTGSQSPTTLVTLFPHVLFDDLDPIWPDKTSPSAHRYHHTRRAIVKRGRLCLETLHQRPEKLVIVVSHSGFLRVGVTGRWFMNADYRVFEFQHGLEDGRRVIRQDESTSEGGLGLSFAETVPLGHHLPEEHVQEDATS